MSDVRKEPVVFVSSTCYDLKQIREDLKDFFESNYGFKAMLSEFDSFPIDPCVGTFENCLSNVDNYADIFVLIVGQRYGYVTDKGKSITNLEYLHAKAKGIPIFVFVSKQLYDNLPLWKKNKDGDFSGIVDSTKVFEFVSDIYDEMHQWVYTYDSVKDITMTMKNQLGLIFADGLKYQRFVTNPKYDVLKYDLPVGAVRAVIEQPYAWEYKFFAYVLKDEMDKLQKRKWDFQYGIFDGHTFSLNPVELMDDISQKLDEMVRLIDILSVIVNNIFQDAIGELGVSSDLEMMIYASKQIVSFCDRLIAWSLYFKSLQADITFDYLLELLYKLPQSALDSIEAFISKIYDEFTMLPDIDDGVEKTIELTCKLDESNTEEINQEMQRIRSLIHVY